MCSNINIIIDIINVTMVKIPLTWSDLTEGGGRYDNDWWLMKEDMPNDGPAILITSNMYSEAETIVGVIIVKWPLYDHIIVYCY